MFVLTAGHFEKFYNLGGVVVLKPRYKIFWPAPTFWRKNTECIGKSPDPLYLHAGDAIHPSVNEGVWDRDYAYSGLKHWFPTSGNTDTCSNRTSPHPFSLLPSFFSSSFK